MEEKIKNPSLNEVIIHYLKNITNVNILQLTGFFGILISIYVNNTLGLKISVLTLIYSIIISHLSKVFITTCNKSDEKIYLKSSYNKILYFVLFLLILTTIIYSIIAYLLLK